MRITLIAPAFPALSETFIASKFAKLVEHGHEVTVVCNQSREHEWQRSAHLRRRPELKKRVQVNWPAGPRFLAAALAIPNLVRTFCRAPASTVRYLTRGWRKAGVAVLKTFYLDANIIASRPDVVHFEFGALAVNRTHLRDLLGCRLVASFRGHDLQFVHLDNPGFYTDLWTNVDAVHCLGHDLWIRAQRRGCPAGKFHALIPPAIDADFFSRRREVDSSPAGTRERRLRLVSIGRVAWVKGYEYALHAVRLLVDAGFQIDYRIVGTGDYMEAVAFCCHQLGLTDRVCFVGAASQDAVRQHLEWADVFVHAAVAEGFCNAVLEAQAMELPVVTSDAGGLPENVLDAVTGFVVPRRQPNEMADRIALLARDGGLRKRMGKLGRERVQRNFQLDRQADAFDELYRLTMQGGQGA